MRDECSILAIENPSLLSGYLSSLVSAYSVVKRSPRLKSLWSSLLPFARTNAESLGSLLDWVRFANQAEIIE